MEKSQVVSCAASLFAGVDSFASNQPNGSFRSMRFLPLVSALSALLAGSAFAQVPDVIHYTFDTSDATNFAFPGIGDGDDRLVDYPLVNLCGSSSIAAGGMPGPGTGIDSGWKVDFGTGDWTIAMQVDISLTASLFTQYFFGSESADEFRCFNGGVAGQDGIRIRSLQIDVAATGLPVAAGPFHIAWVHDASLQEVRVYVDGAPFLTQPQPVPLNLFGSAQDFDVLTYSSFRSIRSQTRVDDFRVYRRAVAAGEIAMIAGTCTSSSLGTMYCGPANANSSGSSATMDATGSVSVMANDLTLVAADMPQFSLGIFLTSDAVGFTANPGGSQGNLCLGGAIGRYIAPGQVQSSGATGQFSLTVDLGNHPGSDGAVPVMAGDTWRFQAWFRDTVAGTATSNFTNGLAIVLQ